ncbi:hypothetical protein JMJ35_003223 [Cladonia borealis]|uniref:DNA/RNA-binding protein Alba-like domain-containing protein n=1 Tax=Cladonia borealis TaxID=184061 RepID=A0AA39R5U5_9LECA|nr:hypothetical protein JMJ35_003223 [Cladonia borealis]
MPQRRSKSKPLDANIIEDPVFEPLDSSKTQPSITKHTREPDADDVSARATKRPKNNGTVGLHSHSTDLADAHGPHTNEPTQFLPSEVRRWQDKYEIITMSILSSSKIEQKVRNLILRMSKVDCENNKAKPRVVKLHAKGDVAGKMVSIVEIAKAEIQKENGKLYQYNGLHGETSELKVKNPKRTGSGKIVAELTKEHPGLEDPSGEAINESEKNTLGTVDQSDVDLEMVDATEESFETMAPLSRGNDTPEARKKVRAYPVLTIYLSRVPIPELKDRYGYA